MRLNNNPKIYLALILMLSAFTSPYAQGWEKTYTTPADAIIL